MEKEKIEISKQGYNGEELVDVDCHMSDDEIHVFVTEEMINEAEETANYGVDIDCNYYHDKTEITGMYIHFDCPDEPVYYYTVILKRRNDE